ncbi:hypothetical protein niasHT_005927 [Heterodera trifolii]|uniref:Uncharacterized protein n=1 Tax=Heterodera trifolii TaxID=157864 RepID=A0ABD2LT54_9BILA
MLKQAEERSELDELFLDDVERAVLGGAKSSTKFDENTVVRRADNTFVNEWEKHRGGRLTNVCSRMSEVRDGAQKTQQIMGDKIDQQQQNYTVWEKPVVYAVIDDEDVKIALLALKLNQKR